MRATACRRRRTWRQTREAGGSGASRRGDRDPPAGAHGHAAIASDRLIVALSETHDRLFPPGTQFSYSHTNYQVAAMLLERRTGSPLADLLRTRLVEPLGSSGPPSRRRTRPPRDPRLRLVRRRRIDPGLHRRPRRVRNVGNGGIIATPDDLLTAMQAIVGGTYLPAELTTESSPRGGHLRAGDQEAVLLRHALRPPGRSERHRVVRSPPPRRMAVTASSSPSTCATAAIPTACASTGPGLLGQVVVPKTHRRGEGRGSGRLAAEFMTGRQMSAEQPNVDPEGG